MPKRKIYESVTITDFASEGRCIYKSETDGIVFVDGKVAPGDVVDLEVYKKKKSYQEARVIKIHAYSSIRTEPFCGHFDICGGCRWQNIKYEEQLKFKERQVRDHLERIGKVPNINMLPIVAADELQYYRNKLEFTFSNSRWLTTEEITSGESFSRNALGFHIPKRFDKVFAVRECRLQSDPSNLIRNELHQWAEEQGFSYYDLRNNQGFLRNLIIRTSNRGETMVIVQFAENRAEEISNVMHFLEERFPAITSLYYIINTKGNDSYQDQEPVHFSGSKTIREQMENLTFMVGPKSFYQTNSAQALELYKVARSFAGLTGSELVYDLYTGTGTIANFVANFANKIIGVEYIEAAVVDARTNSLNNNIFNTEFVSGDMKEVLSVDFLAKHGRPDVVITDPPRAGMDAPVVQVLLNAAPSRIVYVSCNSATQARDIEMMSSQYRVEQVQPVDMFPNTHHVESVALLVRI
ncbi:23S rRNA (uracil(1939)-C(5))-methyltransferase RlmD [Ravibacter arvi]|uniref:23S rRNA (Uracil(1939)-C(5))-methyltransferase RlmD n=1 Tax=Ravibacter arvi TaxID=2051041 RepID=A0ABP8LMT7_9BACT